MKKKKEFVDISVPLVPEFSVDKLPGGTEPSRHREVKKIGIRNLPPIEPLNIKDLKVTRLRAKVRLIDAMKNREKTSREYRKRYEQGDKAAVIELLEKDARFINERWVKEAWLRRGSKRGNKWGNTRIDRRVILGLVDSLADKGMSRERAFHSLSKRIGITYERIKALYYESRKVSTYQPILFPGRPVEDTEEPRDIESLLTKTEEAFKSGKIYSLESIVKEYLSADGDPAEVQRIVSTYINEARTLLEQGEFSSNGKRYNLTESHKGELKKQLSLAEIFQSEAGIGKGK